MSAILLGKNPLESMFESEEVESKQKNSLKDDKEQVIRGKNKTYVISKTKMIICVANVRWIF